MPDNESYADDSPVLVDAGEPDWSADLGAEPADEQGEVLWDSVSEEGADRAESVYDGEDSEGIVSLDSFGQANEFEQPQDGYTRVWNQVPEPGLPDTAQFGSWLDYGVTDFDLLHVDKHIVTATVDGAELTLHYMGGDDYTLDLGSVGSAGGAAERYALRQQRIVPATRSLEPMLNLTTTPNLVALADWAALQTRRTEIAWERLPLPGKPQGERESH